MRKRGDTEGARREERRCWEGELRERGETEGREKGGRVEGEGRD